jgi:hypothetical protein
MDSLFNILGQKDFDEPPEIAKIKAYVRDKYRANAGVLVREKDIIISVDNASLANSLRLRSVEIKKLCDLNKRLIFKIS